MKRLLLASLSSLSVLAAAASAEVNPARPKIPDRHFDAASFGAKGDGLTVETSAIQAAIDAADKAGGGVVELGKGVHLTGPLRLTSNLNFQLDDGAILRALPLDQYPGGIKEGRDIIYGSGLHDVAITGKGMIDGQGDPWWPYAKTRGARRPRMIAISGSHRVLLEGVTLKDSPMFHIAISGHSEDVTVEGLTIRAPASEDPVRPGHNTDACDVSANRVLVENCDISVGDDDFTCGGGTANVLIRHNVYGMGHGVSIGSPIRGGVENLTCEDCTFTGTDCGIRIKSDRDRGGLVHHLMYRNLKMVNVEYPILVYATYNAKGQFRDLTHLTAKLAATYPSAPVTDRTPRYEDISFVNITATAKPGRRAGLIWGLPEAPAKGITLENVVIKADIPFGVFGAEVKVVNCQIPGLRS